MNYIPNDDGRWVDENFLRLNEVIHDYDPTLDLRFIPEHMRTREDKKPYVIIDTVHNHPVAYYGPFSTPEEILTDLFNADNKHGNVLDRLEARNAAVEVLRLKEEMEQREQLNDEAAFLMRTNKNYIKHNGMKLDDQLRRIG